MKLGLVSDGFGGFPLPQALDHIARLGLTHVEFALGGWSSAPHLNIAELLANAKAREDLLGALKERNNRKR